MEYKYLNYPRPNFRRNNFISLNGEWDFLFENSDVGERKPRYIEFPKDCKKINVPYAYQCELSGINERKKCEVIWYHKHLSLDIKEGQRAIIHFGAVDYLSKLYVNKQFVGQHEGGFTEFSFDITPFLNGGEADIVLYVNDTYDITQPRGKQKWRDDPFGCWYWEVSGIWKPAWIEVVDDVYIDHFRITPMDNGIVRFETFLNKKFKGLLNTVISKNNQQIMVNSAKISGDSVDFKVSIKDPEFWTPESPNLYDVSFELVDKSSKVFDHVDSYFGYRLVGTNGNKILINKKPEFLRLVLEQSFYKKGILTFANYKELTDEVELIKELGFNGLRMHQKVEDARFYYACDVLGLYVWSEMPSPYEFDEHTVASTINEWKQVLKEHYNFPSIIVWTPLNECWGVPGIRTEVPQQKFADQLYDITKSFDQSRLCVSDDGWLHCKTDLVTLHNYCQDPAGFKKYIDNSEEIVKKNLGVDHMNAFVPFANGYKYEGQPILWSEMSGIGFNVENYNNGWGYGKNVEGLDEYIERYRGLVEAVSQPDKIAGFCVTQITDVYQEINGLCTMDRLPKAKKEVFYEINTSVLNK